MKLSYIGRRTDDGCEILVREQETGHEWLLPLRLDLFNHSPSGFEWSYSGSGPAQTALAILTYHLLKKDNWPPVMTALGLTSLPNESERLGVQDHEYLAIRFHQQFKSRVIIHLPTDEWTMTEDGINELILKTRGTPITEA